MGCDIRQKNSAKFFSFSEYRLNAFRSIVSKISIGYHLREIVNRKNLTYEKRLGLLHFLLQPYTNGALARGALAAGAAFVSDVKSTVS